MMIRRFFNKRKQRKFQEKAENDPDFRFQINISKNGQGLIQVFPQDVFRKDFNVQNLDGYAILVLIGNVPILNENFEKSRFNKISNELVLDGKKKIVFMERDYIKLTKTLKEMLKVVFELTEEENYTTQLIEL